MRLYRAGALPRDTEAALASMSEWLAAAVRESGAHEAWGRYFTDVRSIAAWYAADCGRPIVRIDVPAASARAWRVDANPEARRFSRDPEREFFLPAGVADLAVPDEADPFRREGLGGRTGS